LAQLAPRGAGLRPPRRPQGPARPERAADPRVRAGGLGPSRPLAGPVPPLRPPHRPPAVTPSSRRNARTARPPVARTAAATRESAPGPPPASSSPPAARGDRIAPARPTPMPQPTPVARTSGG